MPHSKDDAAEAPRGQASRAKSDNEFRQWLNRELKRLYDEPVNEPIPDSLRKLLEELPEEGEGEKKKKKE